MTSKIMVRGVQDGTLVLVDGIPMNMDGRYNLDDIPSDAIERIEVVKGGGSVLYGSEATGGVINIITKKQLRNKIKEIDPHAFIIITTSSEIIGRGFRSV